MGSRRVVRYFVFRHPSAYFTYQAHLSAGDRPQLHLSLYHKHVYQGRIFKCPSVAESGRSCHQNISLS